MTQTAIPGTDLHLDPVGYAGRLESIKGTLVDAETNLGSKHTELGLVASELLRGDQPEMEPEQLRQILDAAVALDEMLAANIKIARNMRKDLSGLLYGVRVRYSPGLVGVEE